VTLQSSCDVNVESNHGGSSAVNSHVGILCSVSLVLIIGFVKINLNSMRIPMNCLIDIVHSQGCQ
jgi:hypothetical protein